jgi:hypothetical protein
MPHPNFVPVSPSSSLNTHKSGISGSTSTSWDLPLTLICIIPPCWLTADSRAQPRGNLPRTAIGLSSIDIAGGRMAGALVETLLRQRLFPPHARVKMPSRRRERLGASAAPEALVGTGWARQDQRQPSGPHAGRLERHPARLQGNVRGQREQVTALVRERLRFLPAGCGKR